MEIQLNTDSEELSKSFYKFSKLDSEFSANTLRENLTKAATAEAARSKLNAKYENRKRIRDEQYRRMMLKHEAYRAASSRYNLSNEKCESLVSQIRGQQNIVESIDYSKAEAERRLLALNELFGDEEVVRQRAMMIESIKHLLLSEEPIKYTIEENGDFYTQKLTWHTSGFPLFVKSVDSAGQSVGEGCPTKTIFGPFEVVVVREFNSRTMSSTLSASAYNRGESLHSLTDFYHPHVSRSADICLGTAKGELISLMKTGDYAGVIFHMMSVLTSYNPRDPYSSLRNWEPNKHDNYSCNGCSKPNLFCDCTRSVVSGSIVEEKFLSPCGCTFQECMTNHERTEPMGLGINGTTCTPSRHGRRFTELGEAKLSESIANLQIQLDQNQEQ